MTQHNDNEIFWSYRRSTRLSASRIPSLCIAIILTALSAKAFAQEILVIEINVTGLNVNQTEALTQVSAACVSTDNTPPPLLIALCDEISALDPNDPNDATQLGQIADTLAVEEVFALDDSLVSTSDFQTTNVRARLDALRNSTVNETTNLNAGFDSQSLDSRMPVRQTGGAASSDLISRLGGFINGHVSSGEIDGGQLQQDSDISSSSLTLGGDYRISDNVVAGIGLGFSQDETRFIRVNGGVDSDGISITAFASWYEGDEGYLDFILDLGRKDFDIERPVSFDPATPNSALSSPGSSVSTITVSAGRNFKPFGWDLGGYFRLSHARAAVDSFTETAEQQASVFVPLYSIGSQSIVSTKMVVCFELSKPISTQHAVIIPVLRLEYVKENERDKDDIAATLIATGTVANYVGERREASYSNLGIGGSAVFAKGRSVFAFYETHLQHDQISQDWLKAGLRLEF